VAHCTAPDPVCSSTNNGFCTVGNNPSGSGSVNSDGTWTCTGLLGQTASCSSNNAPDPLYCGNNAGDCEPRSLDAISTPMGVGGGYCDNEACCEYVWTCTSGSQTVGCTVNSNNSSTCF
jgi:hypothetical protein